MSYTRPCVSALLALAFGVGLAVAPAHAETVNCTPITAVPFTIVSPGIYCLTQSLTVPGVDLTPGITITANDVVLDLNGWTLSLSTGACVTCLPAGIFVTGHRTTVRNGTIRGFFIGLHSGNPAGFDALRNTFEGLRVDQSRQHGMEISSAGDIVRDNVVTSTMNSAIHVSLPQVRIINNDVEDVGDGFGAAGIVLAAGSMAINNRITRVTGGEGHFGIQCMGGGRIRDNVVMSVPGGTRYDPACTDLGNNN